MADSKWRSITREATGGDSDAPAGPHDIYTPAAAPEPNWEEMRCLLSEPRQTGLGEGPVTEGWLPRRSDENGGLQSLNDQEPPAEGLKGLLQSLQEDKPPPPRVWPTLRLDLTFPDYFRRVAAARGKARNALIDPYTELLAEFGDIDPAQASYDAATSYSYAYAAAANLQQGRRAVAAWHLRAAEASFRKAAKADAHDPDILWHLGAAQLLRRKNRRAVTALKTCCAYRPGDARTRVTLGLAHFHNQDYPAAEECFHYEKTSEGRGAAVRSLLICSLRMQQKWEQASMEALALSQSFPATWREMAAQCNRCLNRGEAHASAQVKGRSLAAAARIGLVVTLVLIFLVLSFHRLNPLLEQLKRVRLEAIIGPAIFIILAVIENAKRALKKRSSRELFGDGAEDLPCWQTRTWMRPPRLDIFGQHAEITRR